MSPEEQIEALADELGTWRVIGKELWPFVKVWGLCGAHPDALNAVEMMANLLNIQAQDTVDGNTRLLQHVESKAVIKQHFEENWFRKMRRADAEAYLKELDEL